MAMEKITSQPPSPRLSASASSSPATVGALLNNAAAVATSGAAPRVCRSPRSLLSRFLGRGSGGFGCRMRLPRYCSTRAGAAAKEDAGDEVVVAAPNVVARNPAEARESPRSSHSQQGKNAAEPELTAASLGLGAGLVLLLSKGAAELSRMAELRAQMERLVMDARAAEARGGGSRSVDDGASVVKERIVFADAGDEDASSSHGSRTAAASAGENAASAMDQMEAELEAELTRLQLSSDYEGDECATPKRDHQLESEPKSDVSSESGSPARIDQDGVVNYAAGECKEDDAINIEEEEEEEESTPCHFGVPALVLERRLHELLQLRHEERIAELETELERAQRKLREKEREVSRWRDTAKLASRHKDESRLR
ncbi:protein POLAR LOCALIZATION DURING ASYMMETRIC DIVISION AND REDISTRIBUTION-like [Lolium rigidum]|uniref:protein POLAR LOCALIZATION DURING ASYMMETRIC DIVISION AND REDISTRIBUTION-like n=1 Tax=Lolium rigidum TaxID=89674 RepID=UPI001F5CE545|nr:protein POLAR LOCALIZATION DURING ASYMMETRIC DIVISION AND REDISTRIBUTION-like [Lolium rigidum]